MKLLLALGVGFLRLWGRTLRYRFDDRAGIVRRPMKQPYILCLWHNRVLFFPYIIRRFTPARKPTPLVSASKDGAVLAEMINRLGFPTVAGSSSRRGISAFLRLAEVIAAGGDVAITPDGPRGPVYELSAGVISLAQRTGAPVLPIHVEYSRAWRLRSWDRFILPMPFSTARVTFAEPYLVRSTETKEEFEAERLRLQAAMMALVKEP
ncbi:MAG TPA: lysophospholipid acyltransferase family protein [Chthoniobacterales bacterium]|nr:lysophospholipid acyltransferase family protein [Chthoniobacterales bacterium]